VPPSQGALAKLLLKPWIAITDQAAPISVFQQKSRVRFLIQFHAELNEAV